MNAQPAASHERIADTGMEFSSSRVAAMVLRYWYLLALVLAAHCST